MINNMEQFKTNTEEKKQKTPETQESKKKLIYQWRRLTNF